MLILELQITTLHKREIMGHWTKKLIRLIICIYQNKLHNNFMNQIENPKNYK